VVVVARRPRVRRRRRLRPGRRPDLREGVPEHVHDHGLHGDQRVLPVDPARRVRQEIVMVRLDRTALRALVQAVADGRLRTRVAATMPLAEAAEAHRRFDAGGLRGKLVLVP